MLPLVMNMLSVGRGIGVAAALALCLAPVPAAAASPTPGVTAPADLSSILARPPGLDYVAAPNGMIGTSHVGPLDLDSLAAESSAPSTVRAQYEHQGFTRGYRAAWFQRATSTVLIERVEEFTRNAGAEDDLAVARLGVPLTADFRGFFDTSGLPGAYGARLVGSAGLETDSVVFVKGNLLFVITAARPGRTSTDLAGSQARAQYAVAPEETIDQRTARPAAAGPTAAGLPANVGVLAAALGAIVVLALAGLLVALLLLRRRPSAGSPPVYAGPGPGPGSGWDGTTWPDPAAAIPDGAPRSPDGVYWYDGAEWRALPMSARRPPYSPPPAPGRAGIR
jgi:hypothetical protein